MFIKSPALASDEFGLYIRDECKRYSGKCKREFVYQDSTEDEVSFNITAFDLAGNSLTVNQTQLNSPNITIDQTNPTLRHDKSNHIQQ